MWDSKNNHYSEVGGCFAKHPFNQEKRQQCEETYMRSHPDALKAQAELELARAAAMQSGQQTQWTATQTALVVVAAMAGLALIVFVATRKKGGKKAPKAS